MPIQIRIRKLPPTGKSEFSLLLLTAMAVLSLFPCNMCPNFLYFGQHIEIFWKKLVKMATDPDSHRKTSDLVKSCLSDRIRIRIDNTGKMCTGSFLSIFYPNHLNVAHKLLLEVIFVSHSEYADLSG